MDGKGGVAREGTRRRDQGQGMQEGQGTGHTGGTGDGAVLGDLQDMTGPAENDG